MYDNVGNRTSMMVTDSSGVRMHVYTYDDMMSLRAKRGNLQITAVDYPSGFDYLATDTTFNYDAAGNRLTRTVSGGSASSAASVRCSFVESRRESGLRRPLPDDAATRSASPTARS